MQEAFSSVMPEKRHFLLTCIFDIFKELIKNKLRQSLFLNLICCTYRSSTPHQLAFVHVDGVP